MLSRKVGGVLVVLAALGAACGNVDDEPPTVTPAEQESPQPEPATATPPEQERPTPPDVPATPERGYIAVGQGEATFEEALAVASSRAQIVLRIPTAFATSADAAWDVSWTEPIPELPNSGKVTINYISADPAEFDPETDPRPEADLTLWFSDGDSSHPGEPIEGGLAGFEAYEQHDETAPDAVGYWVHYNDDGGEVTMALVFRGEAPSPAEVEPMIATAERIVPEEPGADG